MPALLITFREVLEISLIVGIIYGVLFKTNRLELRKYVWNGIVAGTLSSVLLAIIFTVLKQNISAGADKLFEGIAMVIGALLITSVIVWMKGRNVKAEVEGKVQEKVNKSEKYGLFFLVFTSVVREGFETVIFLTAVGVNFASGDPSILYAFAGMIAGAGVGYLIYRGLLGSKIKIFFQVTNYLLIFIAAGMITHGIHELQEIGLLSVGLMKMWDVNFILNDKGTIGSILRAMFGYNGDPTFLEVFVYFIYMVFALLLLNIEKLKKLNYIYYQTKNVT